MVVVDVVQDRVHGYLDLYQLGLTDLDLTDWV